MIGHVDLLGRAGRIESQWRIALLWRIRWQSMARYAWCGVLGREE